MREKGGRGKEALGAFVIGVLLLSTIALGGCSGATEEEKPSESDPAAAAALVDEGLNGLKALLESYDGNADPLPPVPFGGLADIGPFFTRALTFDDNNDTARFFGAIANLLAFLDGDETRALLTKLQWSEFRTDGTLEDFITATGQASGMSDCTPTPETCIDLIKPEVAIGGVDPLAANVTIAELLQYVTVSTPSALNRSIGLLAGISPQFSVVLTFTPLGGSEVSLEIDHADAKLLQALLSAARTALLLPSIYRYPGIDAFLAPYWVEAVPGVWELDVTDGELEAYFLLGLNGIAGDGDEPLSANPAGIAALKTAIGQTLTALDQTIVAFSLESIEDLDQSDDLLPAGLLFDLFAATPLDYDAKNEVVLFFLQPLLRTIREAKAALAPAGAQIRWYEPAAFIQSFSVCEVSPGNTGDPLPGNDAANTVNPLPALTTDIGSWTALNPAGETLTGLTGEGFYTFTMNSATGFSLYTRSAGGAPDTVGSIGYTDGSDDIVPWDVDKDAGEGANFGLSIDPAYFGTVLPAAPVTFYVRVGESTGDAYDLILQPDDGTFPPIFLKGGGGRTFVTEVFRLATLHASLGGLVEVAGHLFDRSQRETLLLDDPATPDPPADPVLKFSPAAVRQSVKQVFPALTDADFEGSSYDPALDVLGGGINLFEAPLDFILDAGLLLDSPPAKVTADFSALNPPTFCADPGALAPVNDQEGGYTPLLLPF